MGQHGMRKCDRCGAVKPSSEYSKRANGRTRQICNACYKGRVFTIQRRREEREIERGGTAEPMGIPPYATDWERAVWAVRP